MDNVSGFRLLVDDGSYLPALRLVLPGQPISKGILIIFPEHVTVRERGKRDAVHLYLWRPGQQGDRPDWRRVGQALEYEMELKNGVHMVARATLESDGVRYRYTFISRSGTDYEMIQAITDPRLFQSMFRDVRLERTYVHRKGGFRVAGLGLARPSDDAPKSMAACQVSGFLHLARPVAREANRQRRRHYLLPRVASRGRAFHRDNLGGRKVDRRHVES